MRETEAVIPLLRLRISFNPVLALGRRAATSVAPAFRISIIALVVAISYYAGSKIGFLLTPPYSPISTFWPPNAILLGVLLLTPPRIWWVLVLAVLPAHLFIQLRTGIPVISALGWFAGNTGEALLGATCIRLFKKDKPLFRSFYGVVVFLAFGVLVPTFVTSFLDAGGATLIGLGQNYWTLWKSRLTSNIVSDLTIVPMIVIFGVSGMSWFRRPNLARYFEAGLLAFSVAAGSLLVFSRESTSSIGEFIYAPLLLLLWAAGRFGCGGLSASMLSIALIALWNTVHGRGPLGMQAPVEAVISLRVLLIVFAVPLMLLAALLAERQDDEETLNTLATDIEDRKQDEDKLRKAFEEIDELRDQLHQENLALKEKIDQTSMFEAKIRRLVDANIMGIFSWNLEGKIVEANEAFLRMVEYSRDDLVSGRMRWTDLTPAQWRDRDARALRDLKEAGTAQPYEKEFFRKHGNRVPVLVGGALFEVGGDEGVAFVLDLTEQKRAEEALRRSEAYLAEAQRLSHTGSWHWKVGTGEVVWSQEFFPIFGFDSEKTKASYPLYLERIHPDDRFKVVEVRLAAVREKRDFEVEYRLLLPGGLIKYLHSVGHCLVSQSGDIEYIGTVMDITERKRAEEERERLRQALADLAHINRVSTMGELAASLAHEIKQPLFAAVTNAQTCLGWLARDRPEVAEAQEAASRLIKDVTRASDIISRIGSLFKKDALQRELVNVNELIREMIVLLRSEAARYSISVHGDLANDLPQIMADRIQLQQVFMNLMLNGIEAMKDMGTPGKLTIKSQQDENRQLLVSVSDTGVGLRPEHGEQIFNAFFTSKSQGAGMGLRISRSIIESHGGRLWAISNSGPGATFQFTLPIEAVAHQTA